MNKLRKLDKIKGFRMKHFAQMLHFFLAFFIKNGCSDFEPFQIFDNNVWLRHFDAVAFVKNDRATREDEKEEL